MVRATRRTRVPMALAGVASGLVGTLAMNYAQRAWTLAADDVPPPSAGGKHDARDWQERDERRNANESVANIAAQLLIGRPLTRPALHVAAPIVHFTFGATMAGLFACSAGHRRSHVPTGLRFGAGLWLVADVIAMPVLGLSAPTTRRPAEKHLQALAAHLVYGGVTALALRAIR
ncbi:DUF1440 domain-containing protein [Luteitalea sp.]